MWGCSILQYFTNTIAPVPAFKVLSLCSPSGPEIYYQQQDPTSESALLSAEWTHLLIWCRLLIQSCTLIDPPGSSAPVLPNFLYAVTAAIVISLFYRNGRPTQSTFFKGPSNKIWVLIFFIHCKKYCNSPQSTLSHQSHYYTKSTIIKWITQCFNQAIKIVKCILSGSIEYCGSFLLYIQPAAYTHKVFP